MKPARSRTPRVPPPPLDAAALERLALRYVERFATTRGKLSDYLRRKVRERGWEGAPVEPSAIAERMAALGYLDDRVWAEARARSLGRRGLGAARVGMALRAAGVDDVDRAAVAPDVDARATEAALRFARRKRLGPWGTAPLDRPAREKALGAMLRAGHPVDLARRVLAMPPGSEPDAEALR